MAWSDWKEMTRFEIPRLLTTTDLKKVYTETETFWFEQYKLS